MSFRITNWLKPAAVPSSHLSVIKTPQDSQQASCSAISNPPSSAMNAKRDESACYDADEIPNPQMGRANK